MEKSPLSERNLNIRRFAKVSAADGFVASYIHAGGKIGVLVEVATDVVNDEIKEMAKNVAMQVAAISPKYTSRDEVSKDYIEHETEILKVQAMNENPDKPENIIEKMIVGRLNKELKEVCLLDQAYVKAEDGKQSVGKYVESVAKEVAARGITVNGVAPGFIKTDMTSVLPEKVVADMEAGIPLARLGEPEDIAKAVLFLVSDDAAYITGQTYMLTVVW